MSAERMWHLTSVIATLLKAQISLLNPLLNALDLHQQRRLQDGLAALGARAKRGQQVTRDVRLPHCRASWVLPIRGEIRKAILYLHGGAYTAGSLQYARNFGRMLSMETGRAALCLGYRLAPEHPFPAALQDALDAYQLMLKRFAPEQIALVGESAGGGLCFCLSLLIKQQGLPQPGALVALSPWTDLSMTLSACQALGKDPILSCEGLKRAAEYYLAGHDAKDPLVSPLHGDLTGLPPCLVIAGGDELLLNENEQMVQNLQKAQVETQFHVEEDLWHVYPLYPVPEAREAHRMIQEFLAVR